MRDLGFTLGRHEVWLELTPRTWGLGATIQSTFSLHWWQIHEAGVIVGCLQLNYFHRRRSR